MAEPVEFFSVKRLVSKNDKFSLQLKDGSILQWKNYGQIATVDGKNLKELITRDTSKEIFTENIFEDRFTDNFFFNSYLLCYGGDPINFEIEIGGSVIEFFFRKEWDSRDQDILGNETDQSLMISVMNDYMDRPLSYIQDKVYNWSRPELKTNAPIDIVIIQDGVPKVVGMKKEENRVTYIDATFRLIFKFRKDYNLG